MKNKKTMKVEDEKIQKKNEFNKFFIYINEKIFV